MNAVGLQNVFNDYNVSLLTCLTPLNQAPNSCQDLLSLFRSKVKYWKSHIEAKLPSLFTCGRVSGNSILRRATQNRVCATNVERNFLHFAKQCVFKQWERGVARSWWVVNLVYSAARPEFSTGGPFYSNPAPPVKQTAKFFAHLKLFVRSQCFNKIRTFTKNCFEYCK